MANVTQQFIDNREAFLAEHIVIVADPMGVGDVRNFWFDEGAHKVVTLKAVGKTAVDPCVSAYWLPWKTGAAPAMDLADKAPYFFTSQLTGCRFICFVIALYRYTS